MRFQVVVFCVCLSSVLATYGPGYNNGFKPIHGPHPKSKHEESKIHLSSAKIILDRPSINLHGSHALHHASPLLEEEPIILENEKPVYIRKTLHGIPADVHTEAAHPVVYDAGYSTGKVLDISAPIQVINHAPIVHERPILIRRPVVVSKSLTSTQDHLEKLHYAHSGIGHSAYSLGALAYPVSKGLHERTLVYGGGHGLSGHGLLGYGGGHLAYSAPLILEQPKAYLGHHADIALSSGKGLHGTVLHGHGAILHGGSGLHGHGAVLHGGSLHGHGTVLHGHAEGLKKY